RILLELGLEPLEQSEGVGGGAGETADHVALAQATDLFGVRLDDGLADGDLTVAADHDGAALTDGEDGGAVPGGEFSRRHRESLGSGTCKEGRAGMQTLQIKDFAPCAQAT